MPHRRRPDSAGGPAREQVVVVPALSLSEGISDPATSIQVLDHTSRVCLEDGEVYGPSQHRPPLDLPARVA